MTNLPAAVRKQQEEADRLQKELIEGKTGTKPEAEPAPEDKEDKGKEPAPTPAKEEPEKKPEKEPEKKPEAEPAKDDTLQHKYNVLQGKYNAEVPRLNAQLNEANRLLAAANTRIAQLESQVAAKGSDPDPAKEVKPEKTTPADATELFSAEELEQFEEEGFDKGTINILGKIHQKLLGSRGAAAEVSGDFKQEFEQVKSKVERFTQKTFEEQLTDLVPDWQAINNDPAWHDYLDQVRPGTTVKNRIFAQKAFNDGDADTVAYYFDEFKASTGKGKPPEPEPEKKPEPTLASELGPGEPRGPDNPPAELPPVTSQEYLEAGKLRANGRMSQEEFEKIEKRYLAGQGIKPK